MYVLVVIFSGDTFFCIFKPMLASVMRIGDWGSDVCSSALVEPRRHSRAARARERHDRAAAFGGEFGRQRGDQLVVERVDIVARNDAPLVGQAGAPGPGRASSDSVARGAIVRVRIAAEPQPAARVYRAW